MARPGLVFWAVALVSLVWHGFACVDYYMTVSNNEAYLASYDPRLIAYIQDFPAWRTAIWALAVFGALLGSIAMLLRSAWAMRLFLVSAVLFVVNVIGDLSGGGLALYGAMGMAFNAVIFVVAVFLVWYADRQRRLGVLR